ncbi:MAG TPA: GntR family transcriptional regulator [Firmicutes bacterium]|jgi:DNA-binding GntR family transcriptional regulator|nr:GntR family transcriptional regulator [Bacillota bacterium]
MTFRPMKNNLLHMDVVNEIIEAIVSGELKPGDRIIEQHIAKQMQISRAPVREAIRELVAQGIVRFLPRKGAYIAPLEPEEIRNVYLLRSRLEGLAAFMATSRFSNSDLQILLQLSENMESATKENNGKKFIDNDLKFHDKICQTCENQNLQKMIAGVRIQIQLFMMISKWNLVAHSQLTKESRTHQPIIQAFLKSDAAQAEQCMREHIISSGALLIDYVEENKANLC